MLQYWENQTKDTEESLMSAKHSRKKRQNHRKNKIRRIQTAMSAILVILIFTAAGIGIWKYIYAGKKTETKQTAVSKESKNSAKDIEIKDQESTENETSDKNGESEENNGSESDNAAPKDIRTVKNTATEDNHKTNGLSICMYHYVYDKNDPPEDLNNNYIEVHALEEKLKYLAENDYFFPTWEEVRQFVDGELLLPKKSVVLTFDDGAKSFLKLGAPLFEKYKIPVTSFLITSQDGKKKVKTYSRDYLEFQSHSHNMHRGGGNIGHGGIFPVMEHDEAVADLQKSIDICGNGDAFAYPYGDYTDSCVKAVEDAGFLCAVTTEYGRTNPGDDPLLLPRVRMLKDQSLESFKTLVE